MMKQIRGYTLRIDKDLLRRARYVCEYERRSVNAQFLILLENFVAAYEQKCGKITEQDLEFLHL